jgi:hypothetical protein
LSAGVLESLSLSCRRIGFSKFFAYKTISLGRELAEMEFSRGKWYASNKNLDFITRSHAHYFVHIEFSNSHGIISPVWQFPNNFQFKTGGERDRHKDYSLRL